MSGEHELFGAAPPAVASAASGGQWVAGMMLFEINLAAAEEDAGVVPRGTALAIASAATRVRVSAAVLRDASPGTPVIPLVALLAAEAGEAGRWVHHGATSQDALDTALALVLRGAATVLLDELLPCTQRLAELADEHRRTVMPGRTLLQQASPTTFGVKCARWLVGLLDAMDDLVSLAASVPVQLGGAVGTFAVLGDRGTEVAARLGRLLELRVPPVPWHSDRAPVARAAAALGILGGVIGKIAGDLVLLSQTEVAEVAETVEGGRGRSSVMPHKRNPAESIAAIAAARQAAPLAGALVASLDHEHERAAGAWQAEAMTLSDLIVHVGRAAAALSRALSGLTVDPAQMRRNLDQSGTWAAEVVSAHLTAHVGRDVAHDAVRSASATPSLARALSADARVAEHLDALDGVLDDPLRAAGPVDRIVDAALEYRSRGRFAP